MRWLRLLAGAGFLVTAGTAQAACELAGTSSPSVAHVTYDPFSPSQSILEFSLRVRNSGDQACRTRLYLRPVAGTARLRHNSDSLALQFEGNAGPGSPRAGELDPFVMLVPAGGDADLTVRGIVPAQQVVPPGLYDAQFSLRADAEDGAEVALGTSSVAFEADVLPRVEMSISGTASSGLAASSLAPASIEFPNARTGQSERVFVNVWSNGPVMVSLTSLNGGILRHTQHADLTPIAYTASFRGNPLALAGISRFEESPPVSLSGASYELSVTLGDVALRYAGQYRDVITVTVDEN